MSNIDLKKYQEFVEAVTSEDSQDLDSFSSRVSRLNVNHEPFGSEGEYMLGPDANMPLLLCGAIGLGSETGELQEIVKKMVFQGKPLDEETHFHMKRELGDIIWYWINACRALNLDPNDVIEENVNKLKSRYPDGEFDVWYSENRKQNDL